MSKENLPGLNPRRVVHRITTLVLTAAYVEYDINSADFKYCNMFFSYLRQGAGGSFDIQISYSPYILDAEAIVAGVQPWYRDIAFAVGAVAAGAETLSLVQQERMNYGSTGVAQENILLQADIRRGMERLRIGVREVGAVGTPGQCGLVTYLG